MAVQLRVRVAAGDAAACAAAYFTEIQRQRQQQAPDAGRMTDEKSRYAGRVTQVSPAAGIAEGIAGCRVLAVDAGVESAAQLGLCQVNFTVLPQRLATLSSTSPLSARRALCNMWAVLADKAAPDCQVAGATVRSFADVHRRAVVHFSVLPVGAEPPTRLQVVVLACRRLERAEGRAVHNGERVAVRVRCGESLQTVGPVSVQQSAAVWGSGVGESVTFGDCDQLPELLDVVMIDEDGQHLGAHVVNFALWTERRDTDAFCADRWCSLLDERTGGHRGEVRLAMRWSCWLPTMVPSGLAGSSGVAEEAGKLSTTVLEYDDADPEAGYYFVQLGVEGALPQCTTITGLGRPGLVRWGLPGVGHCSVWDLAALPMVLCLDVFRSTHRHYHDAVLVGRHVVFLAQLLLKNDGQPIVVADRTLAVADAGGASRGRLRVLLVWERRAVQSTTEPAAAEAIQSLHRKIVSAAWSWRNLCAIAGSTVFGMDLVPNSAIPELQIINSDMAPARVAAVRANVTNTIPWQSSDSIAETASQAARRIQSAYRGQLARRAARTLFEWRHFHRHITIHCNFARLRRTGIGRPRRWRSYLMWATPAVLVAARPNGDITVKTPACARTGQTLQITLPNHHVIFVRMPVGVIPGAHFVQTVGSRLLAPESKIRRCLALCANWEFRLRRAQHLRHGVFQRVKVVETSMQLRRISRLLLTTAAIVMQAHFRGRQRRTHIRSACGQLVRMEKNAIGVRTPNMRLVLRTLLNRAQKVRVSALREQVAQSAEVYVWAKVVDSDLATGSSPAAHTVPLRYWTKALAKVASSSPIISIVIDVDCSRRQIFQAKLGLLLRWLPRFRDHVMARGSGSDQPRRRIKLSSSENPAIMFLLLRFVHGHSITVSETNIIDLIMMARSYGARGEGSERMIQSMSKLLSVANCCNMLESVQLVEVQMTEKCLQRLTTRLQVDIMRFIYHNIAEVAVSQGVVNLSASALKSILLNDQLQLCDEGEILSMVLRWLQHDLRKRSTALGWICPCIRWPNVPLQLLQQHVNAALVEASFAATESARAAAAAQEATAAAESANGSNAPKDREGALRDSEWTRTYRVIAPAVARASLELDSAFIRKLEVGELVVCVEQVVLDESGVVRLQIVDTRAERDELWVSLRAADGSLLLQHQSDSSTKEDSGRRTTAYWLCGVPASVIDSMEDLRSLLDQIGEVSSVDLETVQRAATDDGKVQRVQTAQDAISHFLRDVPLFAGLSAHDFAQLTKVSFSDTRQFRRGDVIMQQGQTGHEFFLLTTGTAEAAILVPGMKEGSVVKHYVSGDYFGELALSRADSKRAATITVTSQTATCISISRDTYNSIVKPVGSGLCSSMRAETAFVVRVHFFTDRANAPSPGLLSVPQRSGSSLQLHLVDGRDDFLERALGVASQLQGAGTPRNSQVSLEHKTGVTRVPATPARFVPSFAWVGKRDGYYFSTGESGVGYYQDRGSGHWDAIAVQANKEEWLRNHVELLQPLSPPELSLVAALMQEHHFAPEEQIVTENEVGAELYILRSGVADVTKKGVAGGRPLISYESGAAFGERALVLTEPRSASVTARGPCCCYVLSQAAATNSLLANAHIQESIKHSIQMQVEAEEAQLKLVRTQQKQLESETFVQLLDNAYRSALVGNRGQPFGTTARPRQYTPLQLHQEAQAVLELHMQNMYPKSAGEAWFAVAHGWWDELCNHCALWPHCASPGPISNKALESTAGADGEGIDFIWVCQQVWDGVVSLYGGGPSMQRYSIACPRHLSIHSGPDTRTHQTKISSFVVELHTCKLRVALRSDLHVPEKPDKIAAPATNSNFVAGAGNEQNHSQPLPTNDEFVFIEVNLSHYATIRQAKRIASQRLQISSSRWLVARAWSPSLGFTAELAEGLTLAEARLFDGAVLSLEGPEVGTESVPPIPSRKSSLPRRRKSRASNSTSRTVKPSNRSPQEIVKEVDHRGSTAAELAFDATVGALFDERGPCKPWEGAQLPAVGSIEKVLAAMDARIVEQNQLKDSCVQQENFLQAEQRRQELTEWKCRRKCWRLLQLESTSLADAVSTVVAEEERQLSTFTVRVAILDNGDDAQPYACAGLSTLAQTIENSGMPATSVSDVASVIAVGGPCEAEGENAVANSQRVRSASPVWYQNLRKIGDCQAFLQCTLEVLGADTERAISRGVQRVQEMHTRRAGVAAERECMENHSITDGAGIPAEEATRLLGKARDLVASQSAEQALEVLHRAVQLAPFDTQLMHASAQLALFGNDPYCH